MVNSAIGNSTSSDKYAPLPIPEDASIEEMLAIMKINNDTFWEKMNRGFKQATLDLIQRIERDTRKSRGRLRNITRQAQENHDHLLSLLAAQHKQTSSEFATLRKEGSSLATQVSSQQGELKSQKAARKEVVSETELPIGGDQSKDLTGESQPYIEAVHGEDHQQDCSSDNEIVSVHILDFSTGPAIYVDTGQIHGGQDVAHVHSFDHQKQFLKDSNSQAVIKCGLDDQILVKGPLGEICQERCGLVTGRHLGQKHGQINQLNYQSSCYSGIGRHHGQEDDQCHNQLNYQLSCGLGKPTCDFIDQFKLKFFINASRSSGGFDMYGENIYDPSRKNGQNYFSGQFVLRDYKFEYHQYKLTLVYNCPAPNFLQKKFAYDDTKQICSVDKQNSDQQMVKCKSQFVTYLEDTMFYDMVVGDKANLCSSSSPKLQLKIMLRQLTKILGRQDYSYYEPNFFQVLDTKYFCSFLTSSHKRDFRAINFDTSELGVKHRWPPL